MRYIVLAVSLLFAAPALAEEICPPLTILTSLDMKIGKSGRVFVPTLINGTAEDMLIDTGGFFAELTGTAVQTLKLTPHTSKLGLIGVSGRTTRMAVNTSFAMGNLRADDADFMVAPDEVKLEHDLPSAGGIIAPNLLIPYDLEFDFANNKVNLLSQKHCDGKVIHWPADTVSVIPMVVTREAHIKVPVKLDGHDYMATLDTGAASTTLNLNDATRDFPLKPGDADTPARGEMRPDQSSTFYAHRFKSLSLEGIAVSNPTIMLLPDLVSNKMGATAADALLRHTRMDNTDHDTGLPDMILGMDILRRLHFYIAYKEKKLYVTPASAPAAPPTAGAH
jgi:predicted aspartyl protease